MSKRMRLKGGEIVTSDQQNLVAAYLYRDADGSKIKDATKNLLILMCRVPGISEAILLDAREVALDFVTNFCGRDELLLD